MDRGRISIILSSLILSTTLVLLIALSRSVESEAKILELDFPSQVFAGSEGQTTFHQLVLTQKPVKKLEMQFYTLSTGRPLWVNSSHVEGRDALANAILQIRNKIHLCEALGLAYDQLTGVDVSLNGVAFSVDLYDFSVINDLAESLGQNRTRMVVDALVFNATTGQYLMFLEGEADFFLNKGRNLDKLEIRVQDNTTAYYPDDLVTRFPGYPSISADSPPGRIVLWDAPQNTRIEVTEYIRASPLPEYIPPGKLVMMGTKVVADNKVQDVQLAIVENKG